MKNFILFLFLISSSQAFALDQIMRPWQDARSAGMGGVRYTTGLYDENFFANPARATANPKFKLTIVDFGAEWNSTTTSNISNLSSGSGSTTSKLANTAGENNHVHGDISVLSLYFPPHGDHKMAYDFGIFGSAEADIDLRQNYQIAPQAVLDMGPAFTVAREFLRNDALSVGITTHVSYRAATPSLVSMSDLIRDSHIFKIEDGGNVDFNIGGTYILPIKLGVWQLQTGAAIDNILGGNYQNWTTNAAPTPPSQPRTYNFGIAAQYAEKWHRLERSVVALEVSDIGNNPNGSLYRLIHIGGETHFGVLVPRLGINQGYFAVGLGLDLHYVQLDFATYEEELGLNVGDESERRYALHFALQI